MTAFALEVSAVSASTLGKMNVFPPEAGMGDCTLSLSTIVNCLDLVAKGVGWMLPSFDSLNLIDCMVSSTMESFYFLVKWSQKDIVCCLFFSCGLWILGKSTEAMDLVLIIDLRIGLSEPFCDCPRD